MAVSSRIAKENGTDTGKGNGYGYQKKALADGHYTMDVSGLSDLTAPTTRPTRASSPTEPTCTLS